MKLIVDDKIPFVRGVFEPYADVQYVKGADMDAGVVKDADALMIRTRTKCNKELLQGSKVKFIATATIGFDHIDTDYCAEQNISWTNAPGCNSSSVEQYIVSALLHLNKECGLQILSSTLGIIGVGNVGSKVARAAKALGMKVLMNDPPRAQAEGDDDFVELDELLKEADVVTTHVPLHSNGPFKTENMASGDLFSKMKDNAFYINSSRGEVVDESALKTALSSKQIQGAILDVFRNEPDIDLELLDMLELATPHIAGYSADGKANGTSMSVNAISKYFGLGLDHWLADDVPMDGPKELFADGSEGTPLEVFRSVFKNTYEINEDSLRLKEDPSKFEFLRGSYPLRREPSAYTVRLYNDDGSCRNLLEGVGFDVIGDSCF